MIGTKLAHYEITSHLGSGGMGDVYQATDSKLGRSVAIKLLPEAFTHDADRAARFEREARLLASLNHSNVAAIYGIEQSGERKFLVMELVRGETLAERIKRGPIPLDETLPIARQIAEALESAHEHGIIHRDLKPANIKVTPQGQVKVLDFGLAKALAGEAAPVTLSNSPTLSMAATNAGVILGTAAYMSPEQAKGKETDRSSDLWAFGCVLYEMLTGRAPFEGDTLVEILGSVIKSEPDWKRLPVETPPAIRRLLSRCLQKDRNLRLRDAAAARLDILEPMTEAESPERSVSTATARGARFAWIVAASAVLLAIVLAIPALRSLRETPPSSLPETRLEIVTPPTTDPISFALSPDGRQIVFAASGDGSSRLWLRSFASTIAEPLVGTEGATYPFWSPDSRSVAFFANGNLKRLDIAGGSPQTLAAVIAARGGTWNADGVILFTPNTGSPLFRVSASGGEAVAMTKEDGPSNHRFASFLPDGRQFLFLALGAPETAGIYLGSLDSAETRRLTAADTAGVYLSSGWLLWVRDGTLVAQRLDLERKALTGDPVTLADPVAFDPGNGASAVSVSAAGLVAYRAGGVLQRQLAWFDRSGKALSTLRTDENGLQNPEISPDGGRVAVNRTVQDNTDIWLLDGTRMTRFTFVAGQDGLPIWSPDGSRIVFRSNRKGVQDLFQGPSDRPGSEELLVESPQDKATGDWSPDGRFILYTSGAPPSGDLWVSPPDGDRKPIVFLNTSFEERHGQFSPNGRWVAYQSNESGRNEIYVRPFPGPGAQSQISTSGGIQARWRADGKELYYIAPDGTLMAAPLMLNGTTLDPGEPAALFRTRIAGGPTGGIRPQYDVARDGRFLINSIVENTNSSPITVLQNWKPKP